MMNDIIGITSDRPMILATTGSVGAGGQNDRDDVRLIQSLLNLIPAGSGGPDTPLQVDGVIGNKSVAAIRAYQKRNLGFEDGRVDARNKTIHALAAAAIQKNPAFAHPRFFPAPADVVAAVRSTANPNSPVFRTYGGASSNPQLVSSHMTGFGAPFTPTGWTINNNAFSIDVSTKVVGGIVYRLEIFQDADPNEKFHLTITSVLFGVPGMSLPIPSANFSLPSFASTQGKIFRGLTGFNRLGKWSFSGVCGVFSVGGSLGPVGGSGTLFQFQMIPMAPLPGSCTGFAVMTGNQWGTPNAGVVGGTGMAV